jgi:hypothetical protein
VSGIGASDGASGVLEACRAKLPQRPQASQAVVPQAVAPLACGMRALFFALALSWVPALTAQQARADDPRAVPLAPVVELRTVVPVGGDPEFQVGPGISLRAGWYLRGSVAVLGGALRRNSASVGVARVEAAVRFHLDPFFEAPGCRRRQEGTLCRGLYGGVGLSQRVLGSGIGADDPALLLLAGIEGRRTQAGVWALELGVGGGLRVGAAWRANRKDGYR